MIKNYSNFVLECRVLSHSLEINGEIAKILSGVDNLCLFNLSSYISIRLFAIISDGFEFENFNFLATTQLFDVIKSNCLCTTNVYF